MPDFLYRLERDCGACTGIGKLGQGGAKRRGKKRGQKKAPD